MANPPDTNRPEPARKVTDNLAARIASAKREKQAEAQEAAARASGGSTNLGRAVRLGSEFIAAILVGTGFGYLIDLGLGTSPWGLLIMFLVGFAAGILNVTRVVAQMNAASPLPPAQAGKDETEK